MSRGSARSLTLAATALALALSGCAGPTSHVSLIGKEEPLDVAFGRPQLPSVPVNAPLAPLPGGLGVLPVKQPNSPPSVKVVIVDTPASQAPAAHSLAPPATPSAPACSTASPLAVPRDVAPNVVTRPAPAGAFTFRVNGTTQQGGQTKSFSGTSTHTVTPRTLAGGAYSFTVQETLAGATTSFDYLVLPPAETAADAHGAIELSSVTGNGGLGYQASFHPDKPLKVFDQPANTGNTWQDAETDAASGTVAVVNGQVLGKDRVDACGTVLDSYETVTVLDLTSPNESMSVTLHDWWATQYGGLPIAEKQDYKGHLPDGSPVAGSLDETIAVAPKAAP